MMLRDSKVPSKGAKVDQPPFPCKAWLAVFFKIFLYGPFKKSLLNLFQYCFSPFLFWFFGHDVYSILAPQAGIEPAPPLLEGEVLTTKPAGKSRRLPF